MTKFEDEINKQGYIVYTNIGDSMLPIIHEHQDLLVISKIDKPLNKYDIVLFKRDNNAYVLHRILKVLDDGNYLIGGDNRYFEEVIHKKDIIGILTKLVNYDDINYLETNEYKKYVNTLGYRRFKLKIKHFIDRVKNKINRMFN